MTDTTPFGIIRFAVSKPRGPHVTYVYVTARDLDRRAVSMSTLLASDATLPQGLALLGSRLITTRPFTANEVVFDFPRSSYLSKDDAQSTALLDFLDPADGERPALFPHWAALPDTFVLALQLALVNGEAASISSLNSTVQWSTSERALLDGSYSLKHSVEYTQRTEDQLHRLLSPLVLHNQTFFDEARFSAQRMRALLNRVTAHALVPTPLGRPVLLPLPQLRLQPHGAATLQYDAWSGNVTLRALRDTKAGDELTVECGRSDHVALLLRQGDPGVSAGRCVAAALSLQVANSLDDLWRGHGGGDAYHTAMPIRLSLAAGDALAGVKEAMLQKAGMAASGETFELRAGAPAPVKLLPYARVLVLQEHELELLTVSPLVAPSSQCRPFEACMCVIMRGASAANRRRVSYRPCRSTPRTKCMRTS